MTLRYSPGLDQPLIPKLPAVCVSSGLYSSVFGSVVEVATMEELDLLQEDLKRNYLSLDAHMRLPRVKRMVIQAHLVIRRISSEANNSGNLDWLYLKIFCWIFRLSCPLKSKASFSSTLKRFVLLPRETIYWLNCIINVFKAFFDTWVSLVSLRQYMLSSTVNRKMFHDDTLYK